jgi:integrase
LASGLPVLFIGKTKNGTPESYPLTGAALEIVKAQAAKCDSPSSRLFPGPRGTSAGRGINRCFKLVVAAVAAEHPDWSLAYGRGRDEVTFHTLRHSFATIGHASGMTEKALMQTGNWRSRTMIDKYVHTDDDSLRSMIEKVGDLIVGTFPGKKEAEAKRA